MWDDVVEEEPAQPETVPASENAEGDTPAPADGEAKPEEAAPAPAESADDSSAPKRLVFKHWIRPRTFQYNYNYDYQKNYYDDVIDYLDRRNKGLPVEIPRAQTWGERALRTYLSNVPATYHMKSQNKDHVLLRHISAAAKFQRYHTKALISRKYSHLGISAVSY